MRSWSQLRESVGFTEADEEILRSTWTIVEPHADEFIERFYARIEADPIDRAVLQDDAQVQRLKATLRRWLEEMLRGPWDTAYYERRLRIGRVHVRVGLPFNSMFLAMNQMRSDISHVLEGAIEPATAFDHCRAVARITDLELAVMTGTFMQSHERKELRSLQDLIIVNLPVSVFCLDRDGGVVSATIPAPRPTRPGERLPIEEYLSAELVEAAELEQHLSHALSSDRELTIPRVSVGSGNDERIWRATLVPLQHELAHVLLHLEELTDVIQAEARTQQAEALARIGSLSANLAHEIRNPLTAISSTLQVLTRTFDDGDRRAKIMTRVQEQILRMDRLVTDLLNYSRPTRTKLERLDAEDLCRQAVRDAGVTAELDCAEGNLVLADCQYVLQILVNLLQNARDAAGDDAPIRIRCMAGGIIEVVDGGPGVPDDVVATLFDPFVTTKTRGTGLGLAISRKLAVSMGGSLTHTVPDPAPPGAQGPGACFRLVLPPARSKPSA